jgi:hypothetical protein
MGRYLGENKLTLLLVGMLKYCRAYFIFWAGVAVCRETKDGVRVLESAVPQTLLLSEPCPRRGLVPNLRSTYLIVGKLADRTSTAAHLSQPEPPFIEINLRTRRYPLVSFGFFMLSVKGFWRTAYRYTGPVSRPYPWLIRTWSAFATSGPRRSARARRPLAGSMLPFITGLFRSSSSAAMEYPDKRSDEEWRAVLSPGNNERSPCIPGLTPAQP